MYQNKTQKTVILNVFNVPHAFKAQSNYILYLKSALYWETYRKSGELIKIKYQRGYLIRFNYLIVFI